LVSTGRNDEVDEFVFSLPHSPDSVRSARLAVRGVLASLDGAVVEMSALLVDELVANAVAHGEGAISLAVVVDPGCVRIAVADEGTMLPVHKPPSSRSESGRGLSIVNAAASRWGVDVTDHGKSVWFELEVPG
jgi:anti-sigma regulatory factor (Ser/Thr protein kinase)